MKWNTPKQGDTKTLVKFLFLPLTLKNKTKWFASATIRYKYSKYMEHYDMGSLEKYKWIPYEFV